MERGWEARDFEWDDANEEHIARHGVKPSEAEEVFLGRPHIKRGRWGRYFVLGRSAAGRFLALAVERKEGGVLRVVMARDMSMREARSYKNQRK